MTLIKSRTAATEELTRSGEPSPALTDSCALGIFPHLPLELRERIYRYILPPSLTSLYPLHLFLSFNLIADLTYNILYVNKVTRIDAGIFYLRSRCFQIYCAREAQNFENYLARVPDSQGYGAVCRLNFPCLSHVALDGSGRNSYLDLMEKCAGVLELALTFEPRFLKREFHEQF
jgi:hypothetical protein